jgi:DNA polymerase-3 subunit alpha
MLRSKLSMATRGDDWDFGIKQLYVKSPEEMWQSYEKFGRDHIPEKKMMEAFENTLLIDSLVDEYEPDTHVRLPRIIGVADPFKDLGTRCIEGLKKAGWDKDERYVKQLLYELRVIKDKGFANYFLLVQTMVREAKKEMLVGPGRGSAAASLVCRTLGITDLNPIKLDLMFERFLDPDRKELPDIDIDFEDPERVKQIMAELYGEDNVASLSTYGTFQIKGLMKDLSRAFDLDHTEVNKLNKKIETELKVLYSAEGQGENKVVKDKSMITVTLEDVERVSPTFNEFCEKYPEPAKFFKKLYGRNRHIGRHASAVIIGDNLASETSIFKQRDRDTGELVTQTSFTEGIVNKNISAMGFVKFDMLGLSTLKVIRHALELIATKNGTTLEQEYEKISGDNLDLDDARVLEHVFVHGNFAGIFQFTGKGIRKVAKSIRPTSFKDVSAIAALYRPGPLGSGMHKLYAGNKKKYLEGILKFDHPILKEIMEPTYGCLVYQEQMLQMGGKLGKLSGKDVQRLRKLLLKKDKSKSDEWLMQEKQDLLAIFREGCLENGYADGEEAWKMMEKFGGYGFNKAHSDAYSKVTMQTAHLATYYPIEFYSALLTKGQAGEMQDYVSDIKKSGVKVLPVDINKSKLAHAPEQLDEGKVGIRLSFRVVNGVGASAVDKILATQPYDSFFDFLGRTKASKTSIEPLIAVGAFDKLNKNMKQLELWYDLFLKDSKYKSKKWDEFNTLCKEIKPEDYTLADKVALENALMGFSVRGSPFEILDRRKKIEGVFGDNVLTYQEFVDSTNEVGMIPVVVKDFKERAQRNKKMMCFMKFADDTGAEFEAPVFANVWQWVAPKTRKGAVYIATFNRKLDEPENLVLGKPGWNQSQHSSSQSMINVDEIEIN